MMAATFDAEQGLIVHPDSAQAFTSAGNAGVWVAPVLDSRSTASVLRFTTTAGQSIEVQLTTDDIAAIHRTTGDILDATPTEMDRWLDQAAGHIQKLIGQSQ